MKYWIAIAFASLLSCSNNKTGSEIAASGLQPEVWITSEDMSSLLLKTNYQPAETSSASITVNENNRFQTIDGFGYTLTGGSAVLINQLPAAIKTSLLRELFGAEEKGISISYLRLSIGASDLDSVVFSYNDLPAGQTDPTLSKFSIDIEKANLIPLLKEILLINPAIKFIATPWSPPLWMKDNNSSVGGSLKPSYYDAYARYFVKYIQAMQQEGISITAVTPQNEPLHPGNNPSLQMLPEQQLDFVKNHLGPVFKAAGITTRIVLYDHNLDRTDYPLSILNDAAARQYVDGTAFHLYAGSVDAMSTVHDAFPDKNLYFTEQWTGANGNFGGDLQWHIKNVIVGTMRNWSKLAMEWNLANNPSFGPHTPGGCTECKGALTIDGASISRNVAYYIVAHASKFVPPGSVRIESTNDINNVVLLTPSGKKVMIVANEKETALPIQIIDKAKKATVTLPPKAVATIVW